MKEKLLALLPVFFLFAITFLLCILNYTPGTFLSGWDTLHPEFDFGLNFSRLIFGVFRPEQGLGALAAHSHMSDLPRVIFLYILDIVAPLSFLRYSFVFLCLIAGPIGVYFFLLNILSQRGVAEEEGLPTARISTNVRGALAGGKLLTGPRVAAFLGALFYLLNLGTLQRFVVPFEMFTTQYAALPWIFLFAVQYLEGQKNKKSLILFMVIALISSPMAYAATLWYLGFIIFGLFLISYSLPTILKKDFRLVRKSIILLLLFVLMNSFWLLPNIYFALTSGRNVAYANINLLFSPQAFLYNKEFGTFKDILLIKNFLFDWSVYRSVNFGPLLELWIAHLKNPYVLAVGYFFAAISGIGIIYSIIRKNAIGLSFIPAFLLVLFFMINANPPTGTIFLFIQQNIPLFKEAFRFPADKVLGIFIFLFALYFGLGQLAIIGIIKKLPEFSLKPLTVIQLLIFTGLLIYYMLPAFKGELINHRMRINIPDYYFETFLYFKNQNETGRIAELPIHSPWGWQYYDWIIDKPSYQGAGFIWFGIKQPVLNRDFDRWDPKNEQYYREMSHAVYAKKDNLFKTVLQKYSIKYVLLDKSILAPENEQVILYNKEIENILVKLEKENFVRKDAEFGKISIYKVNDQINTAYLIKNAPVVSPRSISYYEDFAYQKYGDYVTKDSGGTFYPFSNLIDPQSRFLNERIKISQEGAVLNFKKSEDISSPKFSESEGSIASDLLAQRNGNEVTLKFYPKLPYKDLTKPAEPITSTSNIAERNFILNVNGVNNFTVGDIGENTAFALGNVFLNTKKDNLVSIYPQKPDVSASPDFEELPLWLSSCEARTPEQIFGVEPEGNGFTIFGKNAPVCMNVPLTALFKDLSNVKDSDTLLTMSYIQNGNSLSYACVADIKNGTCLSYSYKDISSRRTPVNITYYGIEKNKLADFSIRIVLDATRSTDLEKVTYANMVFSLTKPISSQNFSSEFVKTSIADSSPKASSESVVIPFSGSRQLSQDITSLPRTSINCNPNTPPNHEMSKKVVSQQKENYIEYVSGNGTACDHFSYQNIPRGNAYLLAVTSRNLSGLPLTMCVLNYASKHCDIYTNLSKSTNFTTDIFLLPPMDEGQKGYDVNIGALGIVGSKSVNQLSGIQLIPFPYNFLSQVEDGPLQYKGQKIQIANQKDINPSLSVVSLNAISDDETLVLSRSFQDGWKAYRMDGKPGFLRLILPFIFGKNLDNHVMINNWSNGWEIDSSQLTNNNSQIIIVYLPQYLQYLGFIFAISTLIFVISKVRK